MAKDRDFVVNSCEIPFKFLVIFTIKFKLQMASFVLNQKKKRKSFIFVSVAKDRDFMVTSCEIPIKFLVIFTIKFKLWDV